MVFYDLYPKGIHYEVDCALRDLRFVRTPLSHSSHGVRAFGKVELFQPVFRSPSAVGCLGRRHDRSACAGQEESAARLPKALSPAVSADPGEDQLSGPAAVCRLHHQGGVSGDASVDRPVGRDRNPLL